MKANTRQIYKRRGLINDRRDFDDERRKVRKVVGQFPKNKSDFIQGLTPVNI